MSNWHQIETAPCDQWIWVRDTKPSPEYGPDEHLAMFETDPEGLQIHCGHSGRWRAHPDVKTDPLDIEPEKWKLMEGPDNEQ